jgi:hypothetical protein
MYMGMTEVKFAELAALAQALAKQYGRVVCVDVEGHATISEKAPTWTYHPEFDPMM